MPSGYGLLFCESIQSQCGFSFSDTDKDLYFNSLCRHHRSGKKAQKLVTRAWVHFFSFVFISCFYLGMLCCTWCIFMTDDPTCLTSAGIYIYTKETPIAVVFTKGATGFGVSSRSQQEQSRSLPVFPGAFRSEHT